MIFCKKCVWVGFLIVFFGFGNFSYGAIDKAPANKMTLAALGDCIVCRKITHLKDEGFLNLVKLIRSVDCAWANCELPFLDINEGYPQFKEGGLNIYCKPWGADQLKWLGIDFVGFANNHTLDYGYGGLFSTLDNLRRVGIEYAGAGKDLDAASCPGYVDTAGGRIAQINCASTFTEGSHASLAHPFMKGRPGLNPLRHQEKAMIPEKYFEPLRLMDEDFVTNFFGIQLSDEEKEKRKNEFRLDRIKFIKGDSMKLVFEINQKDLKRICDSIKVARRNARFVTVSVHDHLGKNKQTEPSDALVSFARSCIDAGADAFFCTGPHRIWGIEMYKGKPIFYSLGNFLFHRIKPGFATETYEAFKLAHDTRDPSQVSERVDKTYFNESRYFESFVPIITIENINKIVGIKLYPLELGFNLPLYQKGTPRLASPEKGKAIIHELHDLSKAFGTTILYKNGLGEVILK